MKSPVLKMTYLPANDLQLKNKNTPVDEQVCSVTGFGEGELRHISARDVRNSGEALGLCSMILRRVKEAEPCAGLDAFRKQR